MFVSVLFLSHSAQAAQLAPAQIWDLVGWFKAHAPTLQDLKDLKKFLSVKEHKNCLLYGKGCSRYTRAGLAMLDAIIVYGGYKGGRFLIEGVRNKIKQQKRIAEGQERLERQQEQQRKTKKKITDPQLKVDLIHVGMAYPEIKTLKEKKRKLKELKIRDPENYGKVLAEAAILKLR